MDEEVAGGVTKDVVVLGAGIGGLTAAKELAGRGGIDVTLVDRHLAHEFRPLYLSVFAGKKEPADTWTGLSHLSDDLSLVKGEVAEIDASEREVRLEGGDFLDFDYLIVALGTELGPDEIPGLERAHHVYRADPAKRYREALDEFDGGTLLMGVTRTPYTCSAAPFEASLMTDFNLRRRGIRDETDIKLFFPKELPMRKPGREVAETVVKSLEGRGIEYLPSRKLQSVEEGVAVFREEEIEFDLLFAVPPHRAPKPVRESGLTDAGSWIPVDRGTMETEVEGIYAVGDNAKVEIPSLGKPLPKAGMFARKQGIVAAKNITADVNGTRAQRFDGKGSCFLESSYGLLTGKASMMTADFFDEPRPSAKIRFPGNSRLYYLLKSAWEWNWMREV
ncbi:MAG: Sulfide-quinone reductase [Methanonatronarchaeales archaeon]|nr:Sulfide-quinone reductase [Methanonatronarchaeales archaeon]